MSLHNFLPFLTGARRWRPHNISIWASRMLFCKSGLIQVGQVNQKLLLLKGRTRFRRETSACSCCLRRVTCTWAAFTWFKKSVELNSIALLNLGELATALALERAMGERDRKVKTFRHIAVNQSDGGRSCCLHYKSNFIFISYMEVEVSDLAEHAGLPPALSYPQLNIASIVNLMTCVAREAPLRFHFCYHNCKWSIFWFFSCFSLSRHFCIGR